MAIRLASMAIPALQSAASVTAVFNVEGIGDGARIPNPEFDSNELQL